MSIFPRPCRYPRQIINMTRYDAGRLLGDIKRLGQRVHLKYSPSDVVYQDPEHCKEQAIHIVFGEGCEIYRDCRRYCAPKDASWLLVLLRTCENSRSKKDHRIFNPNYDCIFDLHSFYETTQYEENTPSVYPGVPLKPPPEGSDYSYVDRPFHGRRQQTTSLPHIQTKKCRGKTRENADCQNKTKDPSGYCYKHVPK